MRAMISPVLHFNGHITGDATNFMGSVSPSHYGDWNGSAVPYSGPVQWSLRRMVLHYAALVSDLLVPGDAFLLGSGMLGLTATDSAWGTRLAALMAARSRGMKTSN